MKVLVAGSMTRDTIIHSREDGDQVAASVGGTAFYATTAYLRLGASVRVVTRLAKADEAWVRNQLADGIELCVQPSPVTTSFENRYSDGERTQRVGAMAPPIEPTPELFAGIDWVHLGPLHPDDLARAWYRTPTLPLALDVQGLVRHIENARVVPRAAADIAGLITTLRWLKAGIDEWNVLLRATRLDETQLLRQHPSLEVLRTHGAEGGAVLRSDTTPLHWPPMPLVEHSDPTGAGDVFFAAYLFHRLGRKLAAAEAAPAAAAWVSRFLMGRKRR